MDSVLVLDMARVLELWDKDSVLVLDMVLDMVLDLAKDPELRFFPEPLLYSIGRR